MNLAELERYFARVATSTSGPPEDLREVFKDGPKLSARELMRIYNRGYHYRLLDVLASVFERTREALGHAEFERLGLLYLERAPSEHPAVERVGRHFAEVLAEDDSVAPACRDLARLEWARLLALVAPDADEIATASAVDPARFPEQRLHFAPSLCVLELAPAALELFATSANPTPGATSCGVAVFRRRHAVTHERLAPDELRALTLALAGETVSRACSAFDTGDETRDVPRAFSAISAWLAREWVTRVTD